MTVSPRGVPGTLLHYFKFNKVFHERVIILSLTTAKPRKFRMKSA